MRSLYTLTVIMLIAAMLLNERIAYLVLLLWGLLLAVIVEDLEQRERNDTKR